LFPGQTTTLSVISNRKQVQDISAKFRCKGAKNGKVKKSEFSPKKFWGGGMVLPKLQKGNRQQDIMWKILEDWSTQTSVVYNWVHQMAPNCQKSKISPTV